MVEVNLSLVFDNSDAAERAVARLGGRAGQPADMGAPGSMVHELVDDLCGMGYSHIVKDGKIRAKDRGKVVP